METLTITAFLACRGAKLEQAELVLRSCPRISDTHSDIWLNDGYETKVHPYETVFFFLSQRDGSGSVEILQRNPESEEKAPIEYALHVKRGGDDDYYGAETIDDCFRLLALIEPAYSISR